jgi:hypothetical protein
MGTALTGVLPKNDYLDLLQLGNTGGGITGSLQLVCDGAGTASVFQVSTAGWGGTTVPVLPNQAVNIVFAGPSSGGAAAPTFRALVTADIPAAIITYAKLQNVAASSILGNPTGSPAAPAEITLDATLKFTGTTAAINLANANTWVGLQTFSSVPALPNQNANLVFGGPSSGGAATPTFRSLVGADLPNPAASTLGGVQSIAAVTSKWIDSISTSGVPHLSQPANTDITGLGTMSTQAASAVAITGGTITGLGAPSVASDAATKSYVDNNIAGLAPHATRVATTAALTVVYVNGASGVGATMTNAASLAALSIDGVALSVADRVLVKNQASNVQNGIYKVTTVGSGAIAWVMTRTSDFDQSTSGEIAEGALGVVSEGTVNAGTIWIETGSGPFTIGTTPIIFTELSVAGQTVTLTGDVTGSGTGSFATTIAANAVTYAKFQQVAASSLVGNATGSLANATGITVGAAFAFSGSALQTVAFTGDVTTPANSVATTIAANAVTTSKINAAAVTYAKIQNVATVSLLGNSTGSPAAPQEITLDASLQFTGTTVAINLTNVNAFTGQQYFATATLTDAASITWNLNTQAVAKVTLGGNRTLANPTNMKDGGTYLVRVIQDGTGTRTLAYGTAYKFPGGVKPVLSTAINAVDILTFMSDGANMYGVSQLNFS